VEFALVVPVMMLLLVAIADFGRLYTSAVAVEAAGREAADFGAFDTSYWDDSLGNVATTVNEMRHRACTAAAHSHLEGYETTDPVNDTTCTNPSFTCTLELGSDSVDCASSGGFVGPTNCSLPATDPPCTVHVRMDYEFRTILSIPPLPASIQVARDSRFRISNLQPPPP
jgi:Flp pilus assembly protein TadG